MVSGGSSKLRASTERPAGTASSEKNGSSQKKKLIRRSGFTSLRRPRNRPAAAGNVDLVRRGRIRKCDGGKQAFVCARNRRLYAPPERSGTGASTQRKNSCEMAACFCHSGLTRCMKEKAPDSGAFSFADQCFLLQHVPFVFLLFSMPYAADPRDRLLPMQQTDPLSGAAIFPDCLSACDILPIG